jgi:hypothetical protein
MIRRRNENAMKTALLCAMMTVSAVAFAEEGFVAVATSSVFRVETSSVGAMTAGSAAKVAFSPRYQTSTPASGSYVVLKKVDRPDTSYATTSVVYTCAADQEGAYELKSASLSGDGYVRLLHELYGSNGKLVGEALAGDIAFAVAEADSTAGTVDSRPDSFQLAAESGEDISLVYDSSWCTNGVPASVKISRVRNRFRGGELYSSVTSQVVSASSPVAGEWRGSVSSVGGGTFTYTLDFLSVSGDRMGDGLSAGFRFDEIWGMYLILK